MKLESLVADVTAVGSPDRAERAILGMILAGYFLANKGRFCGGGGTLWCRNPLLNSNNLGSFDEDREVGNRCKRCQMP